MNGGIIVETIIYRTSDVLKAALKLQQGELISFPTETVYGLGADATNEAAVKKVYAAKGRPSDNPLIVHISAIEEVGQYVKQMPEIADKLMETFWPGPLTLIFKVKEQAFAPTVTAGLDSVAMRMPDNALTLQLIRESGKPLVGPSANTSGKPSPTTAEHVFHDLKGKIAGVLDDGETGVGLESTVLDITDPEKPTILRPGATTKEALEQVIGTVYVDQHLISSDEVPKAPGMKYTHYSPNEPVVIVAGDKKVWEKAIETYKRQGEKIGLLANQDILHQFQADVTAVYSLGENKNINEASRLLYSGLRYFEATQATVILAQAYTQNGLGEAYMNRLQKAAGNHFFE
ncbi:L-threonylcarbamoyladenylate synthase [Carnobacterium sp. ISL-102]|uniref:L-threonylcarbamoyladenylate synthase n=1 Tax=Carnobacterium sp. ISL-102 TaxID=2819142 RepID=UPI001BEB0C08|nr:L-threonylcarbamoyladenylate synthase [Carnobacterium sp. ISL-102]MBT2732497.1 threonylcarbamoyl-AMP synthase [Carnobacterium sp. ISL-102]